MSQPVKYALRDPFFMSRISPAVTVADVTIHMRADTIDRDEPDDPRVVWEYIIEGPSMYHAGRDVTTPYLGPGTVAEQLPAATGTLLEHLGHAADGDDLDTDAPRLPHPVLQWARANHDQITAMADLVANGAQQPMPASAVWFAITRDPDQTSLGRWRVGQATQHADAMTTLSPRAGATDGLVVRDEQWHDTALARYTSLTNATKQVAPDASACVVAGHASIRAWLAGPAPDGSAPSMAQFLNVRESGLDWDRIPDLVDQAQLAGLFGVPGHTLQAHVVFEEHPDALAYLITIATPAGTNLTTMPMAANRLDLLAGASQAVTQLLNQFAARVGDALASTPSPSTTTHQARPFPRLDATPAAQPGSTATLATTSDAHRRAR